MTHLDLQSAVRACQLEHPIQHSMSRPSDVEFRSYLDLALNEKEVEFVEDDPALGEEYGGVVTGKDDVDDASEVSKLSEPEEEQILDVRDTREVSDDSESSSSDTTSGDDPVEFRGKRFIPPDSKSIEP